MTDNNEKLQNIPVSIRTANMKEIFGIDVDCYILDESTGWLRVIGQRGMTKNE